MLGVILSALLVAGCASHNDRSAVSQVPQAQSETESPQDRKDYSQEEFRLVSSNDEIISTLRNGLVVIVKRTASPVCAVRAYALTGGVYEGKWLGGGLSHLLEHLVAGGTNGRRTEEQNRDLLQSIGNNSNAYTDYDHTAFFVNTTTEHVDEAVARKRQIAHRYNELLADVEGLIRPIEKPWATNVAGYRSASDRQYAASSTTPQTWRGRPARSAAARASSRPFSAATRPTQPSGAGPSAPPGTAENV